MKKSTWLAFLDRSNLTVSSVTACFVLFTRSVGVAYFSAGAVMCSITVKLIKRAIRQPRPVVAQRQQKKTYGMPSTHSAVIAYFATCVPLACVYLPIHESLPASWMTRVLPPLIVVPWATLIGVSRVWLGHHTWLQVMVGCLCGVGFALIWFMLWTNGVDEYGLWLERNVDLYFART